MSNKNIKLNMPYSTAQNILRKSIMFHLAQKSQMDNCFHCNLKIENINEFSIEHKIPWMSGTDATLFWDIDNIAFSHLKCNISKGRKNTPDNIQRLKNLAKSNTIICPKNFNHCSRCKQMLPFEMFSKNNKKKNGLQTECKNCRKIMRK